MTFEFRKHLLSELHMVVYRAGDPSRIDDRCLCEAVTVNENLRSLGFVLRPVDILRLAVSPSLYTFYQDVKELVPDVKAQPMYPGFPQQVLEMSEAEFRFHQAHARPHLRVLRQVFGHVRVDLDSGDQNAANRGQNQCQRKNPPPLPDDPASRFSHRVFFLPSLDLTNGSI